MTPSADDPTNTFEFDLAAYRLSAIKKAAYRYLGHFEVSIEIITPDRVRVVLRPLAKTPAWSCDAKTLPNEVLDQELRETIAEETHGVRDLLLAQAFSGLPLTDPIGESADYRDDPLGIAAIRTGPER